MLVEKNKLWQYKPHRGDRLNQIRLDIKRIAPLGLPSSLSSLYYQHIAPLGLEL